MRIAAINIPIGMSPSFINAALQCFSSLFTEKVVQTVHSSIIMDDTEPKMVVVVCVAMVEEKYANQIGDVTFSALTNEIHKYYGAAKEEKIQ